MRYPLFGIGNEGISPTITAQRRVNLYLQPEVSDDKTAISAIGTPGLDLFTDFGDTPNRGEWAVGDFDYFVHRGTLFQVNNAGVQTAVGTLLTTTGRVSIVDNRLQLMIVDGQYGYVYTIASNTFVQITDGDYVPANTVTWQDSYFIQEQAGTQRFYISALGDPTSWDPLDFASAEASPDNIIHSIADHGELVFFGDVTTEFWGDSGAQAFPYARLGSAVLETGLAARWSVTKYKQTMMFLGRNKTGQVQVYMLVGYTAQAVTTPAEDYHFNQFATVDDATAISYMQNGHNFYQINFPSANESWLYDDLSGTWSELVSDTGRHRAEIGSLYLGHIVVTDYANGKVYRQNQNTYTDNGTAIVRRISSRHIFDKQGDDDYKKVTYVQLDFEPGVGLNGYIPPENYLGLTGAVGMYANTPSSTANSQTGSFGIIIKLQAVNYAAGALQMLYAKTDNLHNVSYFFFLGTSGELRFNASADGTNQHSTVSSVLTGFAALTTNYIGMWFDATTGNVFFYTSLDGGIWPQLGATQNLGITSIFAGNSDLEIGARAGGTLQPFNGNIFLANLYTSNPFVVGGLTPVAAFRPNDTVIGATSFKSATSGETYTLQGAAIISATAAGGPQGGNPQCMLRISNDGGINYKVERWRGMGRIGQRRARTRYNRTGHARDRVFEAVISDPVKVVLTGAWLGEQP